MFKLRPYSCIPVCRSVPQPYYDSDIEPTRAFAVGERVSLHLDQPVRHEGLSATVVEVVGETIVARARHSAYSPHGHRLIADGEILRITRNEVFAVSIPDPED